MLDHELETIMKVLECCSDPTKMCVGCPMLGETNCRLRSSATALKIIKKLLKEPPND